MRWSKPQKLDEQNARLALRRGTLAAGVLNSIAQESTLLDTANARSSSPGKFSISRAAGGCGLSPTSSGASKGETAAGERGAIAAGAQKWTWRAQLAVRWPGCAPDS